MILIDQLRLAINDHTNNDKKSFMCLTEAYKPIFDENEFKLMVEKGTKAWSGVPLSWLEDLRGN